MKLTKAVLDISSGVFATIFFKSMSKNLPFVSCIGESTDSDNEDQDTFTHRPNQKQNYMDGTQSNQEALGGVGPSSDQSENPSPGVPEFLTSSRESEPGTGLTSTMGSFGSTGRSCDENLSSEPRGASPPDGHSTQSLMRELGRSLQI